MAGNLSPHPTLSPEGGEAKRKEASLTCGAVGEAIAALIVSAIHDPRTPPKSPRWLTLRTLAELVGLLLPSRRQRPPGLQKRNQKDFPPAFALSLCILTG